MYEQRFIIDVSLPLSLSPPPLPPSLSIAPPLPPLTYNDQQVSHTLDYGVPGINLFADVSNTNYSGGFQWWFNGLPIADSALNYQLSDDMLTLTILGITFENIGLYQVDLVDVDPEAQFLNFYIDVRKCSRVSLEITTKVHEMLQYCVITSLSVLCTNIYSMTYLTT